MSCPSFIKWLNLKLKPNHWNQYSRSPNPHYIHPYLIKHFCFRYVLYFNNIGKWLVVVVGGGVGRNFRSLRIILWIVCLTCFVQIHGHRCKKCLNCYTVERIGLSLLQFLLLLPFISVYNLS